MYHIARNIKPYGACMKSNFPLRPAHIGCIDVKHRFCDEVYEINGRHSCYNIKTYLKPYTDNSFTYNRLQYACLTSRSRNKNIKDTLLIQRHSFHISSFYYVEDSKEKLKILEEDEKSKVEEFVEHQKQKLEKKRKIRAHSEKYEEAFLFKVDPKLTETGSETAPAKPSAVSTKPTLRARIMHEVKHYYTGFRLLYLDIVVAARLLWQSMKGNSLSRRERKQLLRTTADIFRLVPFSVFIVIPFMEFLLPVAIKLFPGMLPSTFEDAKTKENKRRALLKVDFKWQSSCKIQ